MAGQLLPGQYYALPGVVQRMLCAPADKSNAGKMLLRFVSRDIPGMALAPGPFSNPLVRYSYTGQGSDDPIEALAATYFDENGTAVALPMKAIFMVLLLLSDKATFNKFRTEVYSAPFIKSFVTQFSNKYGLPLVSLDKWAPITAAMKSCNKRKRDKTPFCQNCGPSSSKPVYESFVGLRLCEACWGKCGATRQSHYISLTTIATSVGKDMDKPLSSGTTPRQILSKGFTDDFFDLAQGMFSNRGNDQKYKWEFGRAYTVLCWLHPESLNISLSPKTWMALYRWNPARASSLASFKTGRLTSLAQFISGNQHLQVSCAIRKPSCLVFPVVFDPAAAESTQSATFQTLFFETPDHLLVAPAVWFFHMLVVSKLVSLDIVLEGPPLESIDPGSNYGAEVIPPGTEHTDPLTMKRWVCSDDGVAVITNGHTITYPFLFFMAVNSMRRIRRASDSITFEIHVSWAAARDNVHVGRLVVGPTSAQMIKYALGRAAEGSLPDNISLSFGKTFSPVLYGAPKAKALEAESNVITKCLTKSPDAKKALHDFIGKNDASSEVDVADFVAYVTKYDSKCKPPPVFKTTPPLAQGSLKEQPAQNTGSKESAGAKVKKRRGSLFLT